MDDGETVTDSMSEEGIEVILQTSYYSTEAKEDGEEGFAERAALFFDPPLAYEPDSKVRDIQVKLIDFLFRKHTGGS